ncbi:uncharacterized protein EKO05_0009358 [Ascochyta rabiei]|uniref:Transmembrane transport n=1 Tax=Didymella rabiei TaxID=5454 RepID=A0A163EYJ0_DIDRA|nr:uncharacterized protein EKO05_0009358 [Ascochyta rabiei]KZM24019.1 transmembrane transport [Ascochyta rabiei]UPX19084.1 hypothetical protein EKO05_0009358 [Ascochyta rabiei]
MAVKDPFTYFFAGTLGFGTVETYRVQAPSYVIAYIVTLVVSCSSGRILEHCWHIVGSISITLVGAVIMISTLNVGTRYFSLILVCSGPFFYLNTQLSWETTVAPRPRPKRAALIAIADCVSIISHLFSPYFLRSQKPRHQLGGGIVIVGCVFTIAFCILAGFWCMRKNKAVDRGEERTGEVTTRRYET